MSQQENGMTPEQSLELIRHTIEQNRRNMERNAGVPMIFWGALTAIFATAIAFLWEYCGGPIWNLLWFLMTAIGFIIARTTFKKGEKKSQSLLGFVINKIWITFAIFALSMPVILFLLNLIIKGTATGNTTTIVFPITAVTIIMLGMAATATGLVLKNRLITIASIISSLLGFAIALLLVSSAFQMFIFTGMAILVLITPGIIMNRNSRKSQQL